MTAKSTEKRAEHLWTCQGFDRSVRACASLAPASALGWAELGGRRAGHVGSHDVISGRRGWLDLRWASRAPRRCGPSLLDTGGRKCSWARLRPQRRCLLRLRGPSGLRAGASRRDSVGYSPPVQEAGGEAGASSRVCVCLSPQCEEMPAGRGLGKCQVGVVKTRGVCGERSAPSGGSGGWRWFLRGRWRCPGAAPGALAPAGGCSLCDLWREYVRSFLR